MKQLSFDSEVDAKDITIKVDGGVVNLEGSVDSYWQKMKADDIAQRTADIVDVVNKLAVVPTKEIADELIGERIMDKVAGLADREVADTVGVEVEDGRVTLTGSVPNWNDWRIVHEAAEFTAGVTDINNRIQITGQIPA